MSKNNTEKPTISRFFPSIEIRKTMKKYTIVLVIFAAVLFCRPSLAQFTPDEIGQRDFWEEYLSTARILSSRQLSEKRGITQPYVLLLEKDGIIQKAIWKPIEGLYKGFSENWRWEIAAYRLDKYLGLNMIPPTVERKHLKKQGSLQLWVKATTGLKERNGQYYASSQEETSLWNRSMFLQRAFDNLIANEDRHLGNYLVTKDGRILLIDHSRSFRTSKEFTSDLSFSENYWDGNLMMRQLPISFIEKIKNLDIELLKNITGRYLTDEEINAVLLRRALVLEDVNRIIGEFGPSEVLY